MIDGVLREIRGTVVGASSAATGIGAHAGAHGALPDPDALVLVVAACAAVGWLVAATGRRTTGRRAATDRSSTLSGMTMLLIGGQMIAHLALLALAGSSAHGLSASGLASTLTPTMLATHTLATIATLVIARTLETGVVAMLWSVIAAALSAVRTLVFASADDAPRWISLPFHNAACPAGPDVVGAAGTRGPPRRTVTALSSPA